MATAGIVDVGSIKLQFHHLGYKIFSFCFQHNIDLHVHWIPRDLKRISLVKSGTAMIDTLEQQQQQQFNSTTVEFTRIQL